MAVDLFPTRVRFVNQDGTLTTEAKRALRVVEQVVNDGPVIVASGVGSTPVGDVSAGNVQDAIAELASEKATVVALDAHIADITDAHDASAISNVPAGGIAATNVQAALNELDSDKEPAGTASTSMTAHLAAGDPHPQYLTPAEGNAAYQPLDADLTSWAGVTRAAGFDTFTATPSSANLAALLTDETGTGAAVFANSPALVTPALGTPTSGNLANCTFPTLNQNTTGTASNVTGTVAVANGGTGDTGTAWSTYTPTITTGAGTITTLGTVTGRYKTIGKTMFIEADIAITTNGTAANSVLFSLPGGATVGAGICIMAGREIASTGNMVQGIANASGTTVEVFTYSNAYPGGDGRRIVISGVIEIA
jgi:hypothetical protein